MKWFAHNRHYLASVHFRWHRHRLNHTGTIRGMERESKWQNTVVRKSRTCLLVSHASDGFICESFAHFCSNWLTYEIVRSCIRAPDAVQAIRISRLLSTEHTRHVCWNIYRDKICFVRSAWSVWVDDFAPFHIQSKASDHKIKCICPLHPIWVDKIAFAASNAGYIPYRGKCSLFVRQGCWMHCQGMHRCKLPHTAYTKLEINSAQFCDSQFRSNVRANDRLHKKPLSGNFIISVAATRPHVNLHSVAPQSTPSNHTNYCESQ